MRADRLLDLVALLRRHDRLSATQLADRLGVSRRTVLRDLDTLSANGVPVYAEHGRNGGFSMLPGYRPDTAGLTDAEAAALFLPGGEPAASALGRGDEFRSGRRKLEAVLSADAARGVGDVDQWLLVAPEGWGEPAETPRFVPDLAAAAARRRVIEIGYRARGEPARRRRRIRPLGLVLAGRSWYLMALKDESGELRTYRADRISAVAETGREFGPGSLTVRAAWGRARQAVRDRPQLRIRLRAGADQTSIVTYVVSTIGRVVDVVPHEGGDEILADVDQVGPAAAMLAGLADRAVILDPPELIEAIVALSRANVRIYAGGRTSAS